MEFNVDYVDDCCGVDFDWLFYGDVVDVFDYGFVDYVDCCGVGF